MRLYKRGEIWWARVGGVRVTTGCRDRRAAEAAAREIERRAANPSYDAATTTTLADAIRSLRADLKRRGRSTATLERCEQKLGHFVRVFGEHRSLVRIDAKALQSYVDQRLSEGASRTTVRDELAFFRQAVRVGTEAPGYVLPVRFEAQHKPRERALSPEEATALLQALPPHRAAHAAFVLATGARLGEAARARREDVSSDAVRLRGTKTALSARTVPILALTRDLLAFALKHAPGDGLLFGPWGKLHRDIALASERAGIEPSTPNDWRRSLATWLRLAGVSTDLIATVLGHADSRLIERVYGRVQGAELGLAIEAQAVPNLYRAPAVPVLSARSSHDRKMAKTSRKAVPPARVELATNALGKRPAGPGIHDVFVGRVQAIVPILYRAAAGLALERAQWEDWDAWAWVKGMADD
jgi:integrase